MKAFVLLLAAILTSYACADIFVDVYLPDGKTLLQPIDPNEPHVFRDTMVGTRLPMVIRSDTGDFWYGGLFMERDAWETGTVTPRGEWSDDSFSYVDSALEAAGSYATVQTYWTPLMVGVELTTWFDALPGEWFVVDYRAASVGDCHVGLYDSSTGDVLIDLLSFHNVRSRDYNQDTLVNFTDFALLACQWRHMVEIDPNAPAPSDLDEDGFVGTLDLAMFSEYWLERTDCNDVDDPNAPCS